MVSCISLGSVFARVEVDSETFDLWGAKAVWNKDAQTLNINGKGENGIVDKAKWKKLKETLSLREDVASDVRITFTDGASFPDDASSFFENVKGEIRFQSTIPLDTSNVVNMRAMFAGTKFNQDISSWNTSKVTDMSHMFSGATAFNQPLNNWDVSNVVNMRAMFRVAYNFNQPLNNWNVSNVTNMAEMFQRARGFNQNINNWDTSKVENMSWMFSEATSFNQPIGNWDISKVIDMSYMFQSAAAFNQPLNNWNASKVTDMRNMFAWAGSFNQSLNNWDTSKVTDMRNMFAWAGSFNQSLNNWNVSNVTNMEEMFRGAQVFNQNINNWDTSKVTDMRNMFAWANSFNQPLNNRDTSKVTDMSNMFYSVYDFNQNINNWDTSKVTNMSNMFKEALSFNQPLNNWNTSNVTNMEGMFQDARRFNQNINNWDTSKVTDTSAMFKNAKLFNQPLNDWNTRNLTIAWNMFEWANSFNQPLNNWDTSKLLDVSWMFYWAKAFDQDISSWNLKSLVLAVKFIKYSGFSIENNDKLLKWWNEKLEKKVDGVSIEIDVPYCEGEQALESLKNKNYNIEGSDGNRSCDVKTYYLTKWKNKNLPITFEVDWNSDKVSEWNNFPEDFGLQITKEKINDNKTRVRISGVPQEVWKFKVIVRASGQKNKFRKEIALIVKKHKSQGDTVITLNTNEKPNDNWSKDTPKQETPVVDKYTRPLKKLPPKPKSLEDKKVFSDDEIFNPTIVNGQCYTRRPYLWIKDSDTIITDEEFKKALSFLRTYEMTMFDSVDGYDPYRDLSREEAAKIFSNFAINVLCRKPDLNLKVNYSDVEDANPTLKPYITLAYQLGVMKGSGMGDGKFRPFDQISKAEVNAVLIRMILKSYLDETRSESKKWYSEYNKVATELGIINRGAGSEHISRNNTALMLFRAYKQQVFEWRLIDYYSYVLQSRDLFVK